MKLLSDLQRISGMMLRLCFFSCITKKVKNVCPERRFMNMLSLCFDSKLLYELQLQEKKDLTSLNLKWQYGPLTLTPVNMPAVQWLIKAQVAKIQMEKFHRN